MYLFPLGRRFILRVRRDTFLRDIPTRVDDTSRSAIMTATLMSNSLFTCRAWEDGWYMPYIYPGGKGGWVYQGGYLSFFPGFKAGFSLFCSF